MEMENKEAIKAELEEDIWMMKDEIEWAEKRLRETELALVELERLADSYDTRIQILSKDLKDAQLMLDEINQDFQRNN